MVSPVKQKLVDPRSKAFVLVKRQRAIDIGISQL